MKDKLKKENVRLPKKKSFKTPMVLKTDAYTVGSSSFQSNEAKTFSSYYGVHRRHLSQINERLYGLDDDRIVHMGLPEVIDDLFRKPLSKKELKLAIESLSKFKVSTNGFEPYPFPKKLWKKVIKNYGGRPPIVIESLPEGSVVYPGEPFIQVYPSLNADLEFGELAAWFETKFLQIYGVTERVTQNEHFLIRLKDRISKVSPDLHPDAVDSIARTLLVDFGDRAGFSQNESELLGMAHLYTFSGTDNLSGNYKAFRQSGEIQGNSILALAHRNVQAFSEENLCHVALNKTLKKGDLGSFVSDLNCYKTAIEEFITPIILENKEAKNNKIVVARPDSGDVKEQVIWTLNYWGKLGLMDKLSKSGKLSSSYCKLILADGLTLVDMLDIIDLITDHGFLFYECVTFGSGGGLRNLLKRDNLSSKYALSSIGTKNRGVAKFSEDEGKGTLPGPFKLLRTHEALLNRETIVHISEPGENALLVHYDGSNVAAPFYSPMFEDFVTVSNRIKDQMKSMPKKLTSLGDPFPASSKILETLKELKLKNVKVKG